MPNPTIPVPPTFVPGPVYAPLLRASVSDAVALLSKPPMLVAAQTTTGQSIPNNTWTPVALDTESYDNYAGHQDTPTVSNPRYYGQLAGWYLCEASAAIFPSASGTTDWGVGIGGIQAGGAATNFGGGRIPAVSTAAWGIGAAKLMEFQNVGTFGGSSNDYAYAAVIQSNSGASAQTISNSSGGYPTLTCRWVCALSGTEPLAVPANPAWPTPPGYVTSAFGNANIRDAIRFLIYPPIMEYTTAAGASLASSASLPATGTAVVLGVQVVDNYSAYSGSTWTAPVAGRYYCYGCVSVSAGANTVTIAAGLTVTSANYNSGTTFTIWGGIGSPVVSNICAQVVRKTLRLNAGDTIALAAAQDDSGSASLNYSTGVSQPRMIIVWQGA